MLDIGKLFAQFKISITDDENLESLDKGKFPPSLEWVCDLLLLVPIVEQSARNDFFNKLPDEVIKELHLSFLHYENEILDWLQDEPRSIDEKYYTSIVRQLIQEKYIVLNWDNVFFEDLEFYKDEAFTKISKYSELSEKVNLNKLKVGIPEELKFMEPFLLLVDDKDTIENFLKDTPSDILDLNSKVNMMIIDYLPTLIKKDYVHFSVDVIQRINFLKDAADYYFRNVFSKK